MIGRLVLSSAVLLVAGGMALADPIEGKWRTESGATAQIVACGGSYCITLKSGKHAGKKIGTFQAAGGSKYTGKITDPANDKTYSGKGTLSGNSLKMGGCVLGGLICRNQTWSRL
ncbi:DUF2147 domain-containing protein [Nitratireductor sp. GISD-1A_MAKvit]|uniref:DUF2147 domain-containing protein n=1 Tax=Nitratireductor sp. GISD-1A_MAKvit TaxID=3234198 RepID=UPI003465792F